MNTTFSRVLKYPHAAVFDKSPAEELAFRLRHASGATWVIGDAVLTATVGGQDFGYALGALTVGQLASALIADGFEVISLSSNFSGRSALVLVEGGGDQFSSNGDNIFAYTSILWALLGGFVGELRAAREQVQQALHQMVITQSEGEWLDLWGVLYAASRNVGETDASYAPRIPKEAFRVRCNARGIELAIKDATGFDVRIEEPWQNIFRLDESLLSGPDAFYDGEFIGYHLIRPMIRTNIDWPAVLAVIERNRAAGIVVLGPRLVWSSLVDASDPSVVHFGGISRELCQIPYEDRALLDYGPLEDVSILNHEMRLGSIVRQQSQVIVPTQSWGAASWSSGATWGATYLVGSIYKPSYEVGYMDIRYSSQFWSETRGRTWGTADSWSSIGPIIGSAWS